MVRGLTLVAILAVCPPSLAQEDAQGPTLGILYWSDQIPGQVAMRAGLERELEAVNDRRVENGEPVIRAQSFVAGDGHEGKERQITQFDALVQQRVDLIIVQPTDNAALAAPLLRANAAGIPVVAYDQYISKGQLTSYLTSDNYAAGYEAGEYMAAQFPKRRRLNVVLVEYPHVSSTVERVNGFLEALQACEQPFRILRTYEAVEPASGAKAGQAILRDYPQRGSIDLVFTVNDGGGLNVVEALAEAGRDEIQIATVDGDPRSVENIKAGRLTRVDCAQFCGALGRETLKVAERVLRGETVPRHLLLPVFPITRETQERYGGWNAPLPEAFDKPWRSRTPRWEWHLKDGSRGQ
jgi:ribose transport system substrate-binding protein